MSPSASTSISSLTPPLTAFLSLWSLFLNLGLYLMAVGGKENYFENHNLFRILFRINFLIVSCLFWLTSADIQKGSRTVIMAHYWSWKKDKRSKSKKLSKRFIPSYFLNSFHRNWGNMIPDWLIYRPRAKSNKMEKRRSLT